MSDYSSIDEVTPTRHVTTGQEGWGFTLWSDLLDDEAPHRALLDRLAQAHPHLNLILPDREEYEDYIQGSLCWEGQSVWVWFETIMSHLRLWSSDRAAVESLRNAILSLAA